MKKLYLISGLMFLVSTFTFAEKNNLDKFKEMEETILEKYPEFRENAQYYHEVKLSYLRSLKNDKKYLSLPIRYFKAIVGTGISYGFAAMGVMGSPVMSDCKVSSSQMIEGSIDTMNVMEYYYWDKDEGIVSRDLAKKNLLYSIYMQRILMKKK